MAREARSFLAWVEQNAEVRPVRLLLKDIPSEQRRLREMMGEVYADPIFVAADEKLTLFSDDGAVKALAKTEFGVSGVWTQALLLHALGRNVIDATTYDDAAILALGTQLPAYLNPVGNDCAGRGAIKLAWLWGRTLPSLETWPVTGQTTPLSASP